MTVALCEIYANDVLFKTITGESDGCSILQTPELITGIRIACDEPNNKHYILYPSTIDDSDIKEISDKLNQGYTIKSKIITDDYTNELTINTVIAEALYRMMVDTSLVTVNSFMMQNGIVGGK